MTEHIKAKKQENRTEDTKCVSLKGAEFDPGALVGKGGLKMAKYYEMTEVYIMNSPPIRIFTRRIEVNLESM